MQLRPYQQEAEDNIFQAWKDGHKDVLAVLPTGAGKTVLFSNVIKKHAGHAVAVAHRQELVSQISVAIAREGIRHRIIAPKAVVGLIVRKHMAELGQSFYDPQSRTAVAGVDTLVRRDPSEFQDVTLWVQDEAHHCIVGNKWGTAREMFPRALGLGVTATPLRADGKGLGAHADGIFTEMIVGPNMRELINMGFLTEYRIFAPAADIDLSNVNITATGDYSKTKLKAAVKKSTITGDIVKHYIQHAKGKLGVTFATDVEAAVEISQAFNAAGVRAEVVSAKTNDSARSAILERFRRREVLQLVNVDLFGEGFDLPAIEVVSMARPTQSYGLYVQQFGRALRLLDGKERAIIIDHVGNVIRHGLPDIGRDWTLDRREKRSAAKRDDVEDLKACQSCTGVFERFRTTCPYCGHKPEPLDRSGPEFVDGDLTELDGPTLARMRGEKDVVDMSHEEFRLHLATKHMPPIGQLAQLKRHGEQQLAQVTLRESIAWWAAWKRQDGIPDAESYRMFYLTFGVDVLTAQTLKTKEALHLNKLIKEKTPCQT